MTRMILLCTVVSGFLFAASSAGAPPAPSPPGWDAFPGGQASEGSAFYVGQPAEPAAAAPLAEQSQASSKSPGPAVATCGDCQPACTWANCSPCEAPCGCDPCPAKPWTLPQPCLFQRLGIKWGGWLQQGITFSGEVPTDRFNGPVATNDRHAEYQMNQLWLYFDRPTNTEHRCIDIGGHIDLIYGTDFRFGINYGLEDRINAVDQFYGLVIPQMYLEVAINKLKVKFGHFAGILDYEAVPAVLNPFYSHSYSYGYTVPQLVTGMLGDYQLTERWSIQAGFHRGWMMFEDVNNELDFMGGVKWTGPGKRTSVAFAISTGPQDPAGNQDRFVYSLVGRHQLTKRLQYIVVHNLGYENNGDPRTGGDAEWYGLNQYFLLKLSPKWSFNTRVEWLRDDDGARVFGVPNVIPPVRTWPRGPGFAGDFYNLTLGLNWFPHPNIILRPECRWDWYDGTRDVRGDLPFDDGNSDDQFTFAVDLMITY